MIFLLGGARSGKSRLAVDLAHRSGAPVTFLATGQASDDEMETRIRRHRAGRPDDWALVEEPVNLVEAIAGCDPAGTLILDCVTLWISNLLADHTDEEIMSVVGSAAGSAAERLGTTIVVSNEVGTGLVPMDPLGRRFRDLQGFANQVFARASTQAYLVVAGRALELEDLLAD